MKRILALTAVLALAACGPMPAYHETREAALAVGEEVYYVTYQSGGTGYRRAVFIDPTSGCEYFEDDNMPRNGTDGKQVCLPITNPVTSAVSGAVDDAVVED